MSFARGLSLLLLCTICSSLAEDYPRTVIVIISQENHHHLDIAEELKNNILKQGESLKVQPAIHIFPDEKSHIGYWTLIPDLPRLATLHGSNSSWIYFCEENTVVKLENLLKGLLLADDSEKVWIGFGLSDEEPSIIHHFAFAENPSSFKYPLFSAGFVMSTVLLNDLAQRQLEDIEKDSEFSIDASHELALFIGTDQPLVHEPFLFCDKPRDSCASYPAGIKLCNPPVNIDEIYFAVKTCHKFHQNRVPFVQKTWGRFAKHIKFFSDVGNKTIPTTNVGVRNTERGHCLKTIRILQLAFNEIIKNHLTIKWVVLADDDTILSIERLQSLLACYNVDTVIGERYGFRVHQGRGYNYLTGGGGIAFGIATLHDIIDMCHCPEIDSPDDMVLGMCMTSLNILLTHSPLFHQARPMDYAKSYLDIGSPVSFHKHWNIDPQLVYNKWFSSESYKSAAHNEL